MREIIALACLVLILIWQLYEHLAQKNANVLTFTITHTDILSDWYYNYSNKFKWFSIIRDERCGKYPFKQVLIEVTGRDMTEFEIQRTVRSVALMYGYDMMIDVKIKTYEQCEYIKIIYVLPEQLKAYYFMKKIEYVVERSKALAKEKYDRIMKSVGVKK